MKFFLSLLFVSTLSSILTLSGCGAVSTAVSHHSLDVQTEMSKSIFLQPIPAVNRLVYVQVKNTSDQQSLQINSMLIQNLLENGWTVTTDYNQAQQFLQVNILQAGKTTQSGSSNALLAGFGGTVIGAAAGQAIGHSGGAAVAGGAVGGLGEVISDALVHNTIYSIVTDVQLSVRKPTQHGFTPWHLYQTRVVSTAQRVDLSFDSAEPQLSAQIAQSIANIL